MLHGLICVTTWRLFLLSLMFMCWSPVLCAPPVEGGFVELLAAWPAPALRIDTPRRKGLWPPCHRQFSVGTVLCAFSKQGDSPLGITKEMTAGAERVMLSDLRSLQLKKAMEIKVFLLFFVLFTWRSKELVGSMPCLLLTCSLQHN